MIAASSAGNRNIATFTSSCFGTPILQRIMLCKHLVRERSRYFEERIEQEVVINLYAVDFANTCLHNAGNMVVPLDSTT